MNRLLMSAVLIALSSGHAFAKSRSIECSVDTDYSLSIANDRLTFSADEKTTQPKEVVIGGGRLMIDGTPMALSGHDQALLAEFESRGRVIVQDAKSIALEGVDIARIALTDVFFALAGDDGAKKAQFEQQINTTMNKLRDTISRAESPSDFKDEAFERSIKQAVAEAMPMLIGTAVGMAMSAALSGDESKAKAFEARMDAMGKDIERKVEARADALEIRANALCGEVKRLDAIESQMQFLLPSGERLNLIETEK